MLNLIKLIRGTVAYNKVKLWMGRQQRNPFLNLLVNFINRYYTRWNTIDTTIRTGARVAMVIIPIMNIFIFRGLLSFIFVAIMDVALISFIMTADEKKK